MSYENRGRLLSVEECDWLNARGFHMGWDVDTCEPQLNHIVVVFDGHSERVETLCKADTLWFHGREWNGVRGDGVTRVERDRHLQCDKCLAQFDCLHLASRERLNRSSYSLNTQHFRDGLKNFEVHCREIGRPDLAMLTHMISVAWGTETEISEKVMRLLMTDILALKSDRIERALELLRESDGDY